MGRRRQLGGPDTGECGLVLTGMELSQLFREPVQRSRDGGGGAESLMSSGARGWAERAIQCRPNEEDGGVED